MSFAFEALDSSGKPISGTLDAGSLEEATEQLHARRLFVTKVAEARETAAATMKQRASWLAGRPGNIRDLLMFSQQMTMMLRAGSRVVPALEAIGSQVPKPGWQKILDDIHQQVEEGSSLSAAIAKYPAVFNETWRAIIASGESTGQTAEAFDRLATMTKQQQQVRTRLIGALVYPAVLMLISIGVLCVLMFFVLPRFDDLYQMLNTPLPAMTQALLNVSRWMLAHKIMVLLLMASAVTAPIMLWRLPGTRLWLDRVVVQTPLMGKLARSIILARIFRVWGTAVRSNVPLIESLELARGVTRHSLFVELMTRIIDTVSEGNSIGATLTAAPLVPRTMASAIATGEQSGQLGEALLFLAGYMEDENTQSLGTLTRLIEPIILVFMGATVGTVAISLFLPLFDLTTAT